MEVPCGMTRIKRSIPLPLHLGQLYQLYCSQTFTDVTLVCEENFVKCHQMILSVFSTYFQQMLPETENTYPIIVLVGIKFREIQQLLEYMYRGEVIIHTQELPGLMAAAEALSVQGIEVEKQITQNHALEPMMLSPGQFPPQFLINLQFPYFTPPLPYQPLQNFNPHVLNGWLTSSLGINYPGGFSYPSSITQSLLQMEGWSSKAQMGMTNGDGSPAQKRQCSSNVSEEHAGAILPPPIYLTESSPNMKKFIATLPGSNVPKGFAVFPEALSSDTGGSPEGGSKVKTFETPPSKAPASGRTYGDAGSSYWSSEQGNYYCKQYTNADMMHAIDCVRRGKLNCFGAARTFRIPMATLYSRVKKLGIETNFHKLKLKLLTAPTPYEIAMNSENGKPQFLKSVDTIKTF